jgi:ABC-type transport system involved in multi-copper enzyme maturation permease subunit
VRAIYFLTLRELRRRRVVLVLVTLTLLLAVLVAWGFDRFATTTRGGMPAVQFAVLTSQLVVIVMFMFSFMLGVTAVFVASPEISGDIDSGIALALLARPVRRSSVLLGKWLACATALIAYAVAGGALLLAVTAWTTGYTPPGPVEFLAYLAAETVVGVTFAILLSTFVPPMAAGAIAVASYGAVWIAGVAASVGMALDNDSLIRIGTVTQLLLPTDGLWRGAMYHLEPSAVVLVLAGFGRSLAGNPFLAVAPPPTAFLVWSVAWVAAVLAGAIWIFRRREI